MFLGFIGTQQNKSKIPEEESIKNLEIKQKNTAVEENLLGVFWLEFFWTYVSLKSIMEAQTISWEQFLIPTMEEYFKATAH